ncbi:60S ribosomal protein L25 [Komagataella phaffii CBS 7435]|uniref:Large ribosomal subunit protein uL23 n=2 Tax=Komagataella phaffii TaxID=460519 RepID=C4R910_KOMPG|nr:60S ribosomal protein L25 [Komagataella phaffii GS115]KAI0460893.1 60S ribosomal protein L25 [Komagataella kurtzmanii]CAH2450506.1 60S ribosomal protein L25 [Komagataella phaffii CBS 7435]CAY72085.1 Primary rRNA-binding ribosomal protein component of the large (60S) ribosomal subunit [Komagataella phaffii GS115]CCA40312.1 60S ribosomal protein L25 [Komagataella phaffii CBS 7435]
MATESTKADATKKAALKGTYGKKVVKVRTSAKFAEQESLRLPKNPQYARTLPKYAKIDSYSVIVSPVNTETAMKKVEDANTLVFNVALKANKVQIKDAVKELYEVEVSKVNTLIRPNGTKKAFVKLTADYDALDIANKIGYI